MGLCGAVWCLQFVERLDGETRLAEHAQHLAVGQVEIHSFLAGPLEASHAELGALERFADGLLVFERAEHREHAVGEEDQMAPGPQQPVGL